MVIDGVKAYVQLASGLTDVTRERALAAARTLVAQGEAGVGAVVPDTMRVQVSSVTDDLIATGKANRDVADRPGAGRGRAVGAPAGPRLGR